MGADPTADAAGRRALAAGLTGLSRGSRRVTTVLRRAVHAHGDRVGAAVAVNDVLAFSSQQLLLEQILLELFNGKICCIATLFEPRSLLLFLCHGTRQVSD